MLNILEGCLPFMQFGMNQNKNFFCARDHFGIKTFIIWNQKTGFILPQRLKPLLPFIDNLKPDLELLKDYITFQLCLGEKTMFKNIFQIEPAHFMTVSKIKELKPKNI